MIYIILIILLTSILTVYSKSVNETIAELKTLYDFIRERDEVTFPLYTTMKMALKIKMFENSVPESSIVMLSSTRYKISYKIKNNKYSFITDISKNPILFAHDEHGNDLTNEVTEYLGFVHDHIKTTPRNLGCKSVTVELVDCSEFVFSDDSEIKF